MPERLQAITENALRDSETRFRRVFEQSPLGMATAGPDFRFLDVNPALCVMLGYAEEELRGASFLELIKPDERENSLRRASAVAAGEAAELQFEERIFRKSGEPVWVKVTVAPVREADGRILYSLGIVENVEERRRIIEALRDSEFRFRTMLETLPHMAFVLAPDGGMEYWNRRYVEYLGRPITDEAGRAEFHHPDDRAQVLAARSEGRARGTEYSFEARLRRHDGAYRWHSVRIRPLRRNGEIFAWFGAAVDNDEVRRANEVLEQRVAERTASLNELNRALSNQIEERERVEAALLQAQKMEAVGQLTGGIAHDFNNLLTAVVGCLELIAHHSDDEGIARHVQTAMRAANRGATLTQQLLSFARRQSLQPVVANLNALLAEMEVLLRRGVGEAVEMVVRSDPRLWQCEVDPAQFEAAIMNLAMNARDAMPAGGHLTLSTRNVPAGEMPASLDLAPGAYVALEVRDDGVGMAPDIAKRAFEPFYTTKEVGKGSGLGLSMVYGFAKQSGGGIHLDSAPGRGTSITICLPRAVAPAARIEEDIAPEPAEAGFGDILLVEDDEDVREIAASMLERLGYRVATATDGRQALQLLSELGRCELLLTDLVMPLGLSGIELARRARELRPGLKVLLMTGYAGSIKADAPEFPVILKPFRQAQLAATLAALMRQDEPAPSADPAPIR